MNYKNEKRLQVIDYIVSHTDSKNGISTNKIATLAYLANKLFLLKYGHTITEDKFICIPD